MQPPLSKLAPIGPAPVDPVGVTTARQRWMGILAHASHHGIIDLLGHCPALPGHLAVRPAETGLVMVRGRTGGGGQPFNLGEMPVTRCTVRLDSGEVGHAYVAGRDRAHAELAAVLDAALQHPEHGPALDRAVIAPLAAAQDAARRQRADRAAATQVEFSTLAAMRS